MRSVFTIFLLFAATLLRAQFPFLHVYLNTPNCYAHSMGVMMLDSIDARCTKRILISDKGTALVAELPTLLGLAPGSVVTRTMPNDDFNERLWQHGFSRFVFGMGTDTIHDDNLDFLFQYADSINQHIAQHGASSTLRIVPPLVMSGNRGDIGMSGNDVLFLDDLLNRITRFKVDPARSTISQTTQQLPETLDATASPTLRTANLFQRGMRYEGLCTATPDDGTTRLFASIDRGVDSANVLRSDQVLVTLSADGRVSAKTFKALEGFGVSGTEGALVRDTLYLMTYRTGAENYQPGWDAFILKDTVYTQVKRPKRAAEFPQWIQDKLHGNFCNGFFAGNTFVFQSLPLAYHIPTGRFMDFSPALGLSLDTVVARLSRYQFGLYSCMKARVENGNTTLVYYSDREAYHATINMANNIKQRSGKLHFAPGYAMADVLLDGDRLLTISDDQLHAWVIRLE